MTRIRAFVERHPTAAYFALTFVISWGGALVAFGSLAGMREQRPEAIRDFRMR